MNKRNQIIKLKVSLLNNYYNIFHGNNSIDTAVFTYFRVGPSTRSLSWMEPKKSSFQITKWTLQILAPIATVLQYKCLETLIES